VTEIVVITEQRVSGFLSAEPVQSGVGQNSLKQQGQFSRRLASVMLNQLHHAVLNDVQRSLFISDMVERPLVSAFFNACQKVGEFFVGGQEEFAKGFDANTLRSECF
jgi:hypothetical protein